MAKARPCQAKPQLPGIEMQLHSLFLRLLEIFILHTLAAQAFTIRGREMGWALNAGTQSFRRSLHKAVVLFSWAGM